MLVVAVLLFVFIRLLSGGGGITGALAGAVNSA